MGKIQTSDGLRGYAILMVSREGSAGNPHDHKLVKVVRVEAMHSDGSEITNFALNGKFSKEEVLDLE